MERTRRWSESVVLAAWVLLACAPSLWAQTQPAGAGLLLGPYVTGVSESGAKVHWVSPAGVEGACRLLDGSAGAKVELRSAPIAGRPEVRRTAALTGLAAGRTHRYVLTAGADRAEGQFQTPPAAGSRKPFTFVVYGDTQTYVSRIRSVAAAIAKEAPAFVVHTGDLTNDGKDWPLWEEEFFGPARELLRRAAVCPARGNHERAAEPFASLFGLQAESVWYSVDYDNLHVVVLDQWGVDDYGPMEPSRMAAMAAWLDRDLAAAKGRADWILVAGHQPMFNVAAHGSTWGHEHILPVLHKHGVDLVVAGHSHLYERFVPIGPPGGKPIIHIVAGGGGGSSYAASPCPILVGNYSGPHYSLYRVEGNRLELTIKKPDGATIDRMVLTKSGGQFPKDVMDAAIPPEDALRMLKVFKVLLADFPARPAGGQGLEATLRPEQFPQGSPVKLAGDPNGLWAVQEVAFRESNEPVPLKLTPPQGVLLAENRHFSPMLTTAVSFQYRDRTYSYPSVPIQMTVATLRRLVPPPEPVRVASWASAFVVDGNLADWKDVPHLHLPSTKAPSKALKLTWRDEGLYAAVEVSQEAVRADADRPWESDGLELLLEADAQRRTRVDTRGTPLRMFLLPQQDQEGGRATLRRMYGRLPREPVQAAWRKTAGGYAIELCLPTRSSSSSRLTAGTRMGFHFHLRRGAEIIEQFQDTTAFRSVSSTPAYWGQIQLVDKSSGGR